MAIITAVAGDLQHSAVDGIRYVQGYSSSGSPLSTSTQAPRTGLRGIAITASNSYQSHYLPVDPGADVVPVNAGRTYFAAAFEYSFTDISDTIGEYFILGQIRASSSGTTRELRAYADGDIRFQPSAPWTTMTATVTSLQDTRFNFVTQGVQVGDWVNCNNLLLKVTSITTTTNPNDTLNGAAWRTGGANPGNGQSYVVYSKVGIRLKIYDNAGTPLNVLSQGALFAYEDRATSHYIEWKFAPVNVGSPTTELIIDGTAVTGSPSTAGNTGDPATATWYYYMAGSAAKTNHWQGDHLLYNLILWDNLTGAPTFSGSFVSHYSADVTQRPYVSFLAPASGTPQFDAWTKSSGTDASALVGDASTRPNEDMTTYIDGAGNGTKQAWKHAAIGSASLSIGAGDTIYAVVAKGALSPNASPDNLQDVLVSVWDGTAETAAKGTTTVYNGVPGLNPLHGVWETDSGAAAWTPTKLGSIQTVVKQNTAGYNPRVYSAGLWVVGKTAAAAPPPPPDVPEQVLGGKGPLLRPQYDHILNARAGDVADAMRRIKRIEEAQRQTSRNERALAGVG